MTKEQKELIKWLVWVGTLIFMIAFHFADEAKDKATTDTTLNHVESTVNEIKHKQEKYDEYWMQQIEINTRIVDYFDDNSE